MTKSSLNKIIKNIPKDCFGAVRDVSLLSCSIFGESHMITMKKLFGVGIFTFWRTKNNQVEFYRSEKENLKFSRTIARRIKKNKFYANRLSKELMSATDWFYNFLKKNKNFCKFYENVELFFKKYKEFFALHQAVCWGGEYLASSRTIIKYKTAIDTNVKILNYAYKYNELIIPEIEKYFEKLKIKDFLYDEIINDNRCLKTKKRSIIFIKNRRYILTDNEARKIEHAIMLQKNISRLPSEIRGLAACGGVYAGRVRLIKDLNNLKEVKRGDILVTHMTRPQFNKQIKNVGSIVTDEGGVLCHAAILAREFNIPCIVGTKIATKVLKDGDRVEVNADRGIVRIIK